MSKYRIVQISEKKFKVQKKGLLFGWNDIKRVYRCAKVKHTITFNSEAQAQKYIDSISC